MSGLCHTGLMRRGPNYYLGNRWSKTRRFFEARAFVQFTGILFTGRD
jgi:hypothetical protein